MASAVVAGKSSRRELAGRSPVFLFCPLRSPTHGGALQGESTEALDLVRKPNLPILRLCCMRYRRRCPHPLVLVASAAPARSRCPIPRRVAPWLLV